ncbi:class I SAM-dependent methyltransferase [Saccharopolyspora sp. HNM0983]|uniref:Class I SAM-dependent methyltransferase n=1 Tax=Saccharopolyspora montiporae TaxID=2781240 RepID=A0A929FYZ2_9PSEU|nr:class I SAM-dependent methyltransferase [Saccharopolyspora sp. HNM0983]MBE9373854.1 class I SAM-dependent methyltransferase [Saccharopolyspora sp. HNM0983]
MTGGTFDHVLLTGSGVLEFEDGHLAELAVRKWRRAPDAVDGDLLDRCRGATLDVGCGPGRLTSGLAHRGVRVLGIDTSATAVRLTRQRGGSAVRADVFAPVPDEGRWQHVLLIDGNIGIGGDPQRLLTRVHDLLGPGGSALVEAAPPGTGLRCGRAHLQAGPWFPWAEADPRTIVELGESARLGALRTAHRSGRWFVEMVRSEDVPDGGGC